MRIFFTLLFLCLMFTNSFGQKFPDYTGTGIRTKTLVVKLKPEYRNLAMVDGINGNNYSAIASTLMVSECSKIFPKHPFSDQNQGQNKVDLSLIYQIKYSANIDERTASAILSKSGLFEYAEPRAENSFLGGVNDPKASWQFYLHKVKAYEAWDVELGDTNVVVGIHD